MIYSGSLVRDFQKLRSRNLPIPSKETYRENVRILIRAFFPFPERLFLRKRYSPKEPAVEWSFPVRMPHKKTQSKRVRTWQLTKKLSQNQRSLRRVCQDNEFNLQMNSSFYIKRGCTKCRGIYKNRMDASASILFIFRDVIRYSFVHPDKNHH